MGKTKTNGKALTPHDLAERGAIMVGTHEQLSVYRRPDREGAGEWMEFYVRDWSSSKKPNDKRAYWLSHNGCRIARGKDAGILAKQAPEAFAAVVSIIGNAAFDYKMASF